MSSTWAFSSAICSARDRQAQLPLGLGQRDPQPPPGAELPLLAPQRGHLRRGIAADQRVVVAVVGHGVNFLVLIVILIVILLFLLCRDAGQE